ncbi:MAG TPA: nuclear transport factor 2 family protein [Ktedonobacterales bacterium]|nr:nuclear transport factor 2 family protein [Ktedonobacterales bacterium]
MQPSPEIRDVVMRTLQQMSAKDVASLIDGGTREGAFLMIGTDPKEWLPSVAAAEPVIRASVEGGSGRMPEDVEVVAYEEGTMGWAAVRYAVRLPNGAALKFRFTDVYHREGGAWKLVHLHASVGIPDEQVMGLAQ